MVKIMIDNIDWSNSSAKTYCTVGGTFYVEANGKYFPSKGWFDIVSSILDMWLSAILSFIKLKESQCDLFFMDGPYSIRLVRSENELLGVYLHTRNSITEQEDYAVTTICSFCEELLLCGEFFISACNCQINDFVDSVQFRRIVTNCQEIKNFINRTGDGLREP